MSVIENAALILPTILARAIPKGHGNGYLLEVEGSEMDVLRELVAEIAQMKQFTAVRKKDEERC